MAAGSKVLITIICIKIERSWPVYHTIILLLCILSAASWMVGKILAPYTDNRENDGHFLFWNGAHMLQKWFMLKKINLCCPFCKAELCNTNFVAATKRPNGIDIHHITLGINCLKHMLYMDQCWNRAMFMGILSALSTNVNLQIQGWIELAKGNVWPVYPE
jgi:hypothetical protein